MSLVGKSGDRGEISPVPAVSTSPEHHRRGRIRGSRSAGSRAESSQS